MNYSIQENDDIGKKVFEESTYSKKKHMEAEERYRDLVDKKPLEFNLEESLAILKKTYTDKSKQFKNKKPPSRENKNSNMEVVTNGDSTVNVLEDSVKQLKNSISTEKVKLNAVSDQMINNEDNINKEDILEIADRIDFDEWLPKDGRFRAFYEENIAPLLEKPSFKSIRDFIYEENDFSNEKYELIVKAFEERTGKYYSDLDSADKNDVVEMQNQLNNKAKTKICEPEIHSKIEDNLFLNNNENGAMKVYAVPLENVTETETDKEDVLGRSLLCAALSGIVVMMSILMVYCIW